MKQKHLYIPPQELKRRIWMNTIARFLVAIEFFLCFIWWRYYCFLLLGTAFLLLTPLTYFTKEPERNSKADVVGNWICAFLLPVILLFTGNICGLFLLALIISSLLICVFILHNPLRSINNRKKRK